MDTPELKLNKRVVSVRASQLECNIMGDLDPNKEYKISFIVSPSKDERIYNDDGTFDLNFICKPVGGFATISQVADRNLN